MPECDVAADYRALCDAAGVVGLDFRTIVVASGTDRVDFLQGMLTNDVAGLEAGEGCQALLLTIQGRVTADVVVLALDDVLWLDVDRGALHDLQTALSKLIVADDVELAPSPSWAAVGLVGPRASDCLPEAGDLRPWAHAEALLEGVPVRVLRGGILGTVGYTLFVPAAEAARVEDALARRGATRSGPAAFEARRIALGVPRIGVDMGAKTLALEVPVADRISTTKGCYLGQEVVARGTSRGQVNKRLCALRFVGALPEAGAVLLWDGTEVGRVTSVAGPPVVSAAIGIGMVRREQWAPGTELAVGTVDAQTVAHVAEWPLG